jgi:hypothetical protein
MYWETKKFAWLALFAVIWNRTCKSPRYVCTEEIYLLEYNAEHTVLIPELFITTAVRTTNPTQCSSMGRPLIATFDESRIYKADDYSLLCTLLSLLRWRGESTIPRIVQLQHHFTSDVISRICRRTSFCLLCLLPASRFFLAWLLLRQ